jgi:hypothetical protein
VDVVGVAAAAGVIHDVVFGFTAEFKIANT